MSAALVEKIIACRAAIRAHRDAKMDERCWLDDYLVWKMIPGSFEAPAAPPPHEEAMAMCRAFYKLRRTQHPDTVPQEAITDAALWDNDLENMGGEELEEALVRVQTAIRRHRDAAGNPATVDDDKDLYSVLPEKIPADFRLPPEEEFLGEAKAPHAGCPAFWRSHENCAESRCNLHAWGPCDAGE